MSRSLLGGREHQITHANVDIEMYIYKRKLWSGIGVKIKVAFHCTGLPFYAVLFQFNVASVAFSCSVAN